MYRAVQSCSRAELLWLLNVAGLKPVSQARDGTTDDVLAAVDLQQVTGLFSLLPFSLLAPQHR